MSFKSRQLALIIVLTIGVLSVGGLLFVVFKSTDIAEKLVSLKRIEKDDSQQTSDTINAIKAIDEQSIEGTLAAARLAYDQEKFIEASKHYAKLYQYSPLQTEYLFKQAQSLYLGGQFADAQIVFDTPAIAEFADTAVYRARLLIGQQKQQEALSLLGSNLVKYPEHAASRLLQADIYLLQQHFSEARDIYQSLLDNKDKDLAAIAHFGISQVLLKQGNADEAISWQDQAPAAKINLQLHTALAEFWRNMGHAEKSLNIYQQLIDHYGVRTELAVAFAELLAIEAQHERITALRNKIISADSIALAARNYLDAIKHYLQKDYEATLQSLRWSEQSFGKRRFFRFMELDAAVRLGDYQRFISAVEKLKLNSLSERRRNYLRLLLIQQASYWLNRGNGKLGESLVDAALQLQTKDNALLALQSRAKLLNNDFAAAEKLSLELLKSDQLNNAALEVLTRARYELGNYPAALQAAAQISSDNAAGEYWQGIIYFRLKDYEKASLHLLKAYDKGATIKAGAALVDTYLMQKKYAEADALARVFIDNTAPTIKALGYAYLAGSHRARKQLTEAATFYEQAAQLDPNRPVYLLSAFDIYIDVENYSKAEALLKRLKKSSADERIISFKEAYLQQLSEQSTAATLSYRQILRNYPDWSLPMLNLSELLGRDPETLDEAVALANKTTELSPQWPAAWLNLARLQQKTANLTAARTSANKALELKPDNTDTLTFIKDLDAQ